MSFLLLLLALLPALVPGQISGTVLHAETGQPLSFVNIGLEGTVLGAVTDSDGQFTITSVPSGRFVLVASAVGFQTVRRDVVMESDGVVDVVMEMNVNAYEMQAVEITGRQETTYDAEYSFSATRTASSILRVPMALSIVTKEVIDDQQIQSINEATRNVSGMNTFSNYNDLTARGFRSQNTRLVNGLRAEFGFWSSPILPHIERLEFIKGPASALFADSNPGGTINLVTKKPLATPRKAVSFTAGSYSLTRYQSDFTGPLTENRDLLYRLNIGYEDTDSFRFLQGTRSLLIAPSVTFLPTDATRVNADIVYGRRNGVLDRGQPIFFGNTDLTSTPVTFSASQPGDFMLTEDFTLTLSLQHAISSTVGLNASYLRYTYDEDLAEHRTSNLFLPDQPSVMQLAFIRRKQDRQMDNLSVYLSWRAEAGATSHRMVAGVDAYEKDDNRSQWGARGDENLILPDGRLLPGGGVADFDLAAPVYTLDRDPETYVANWFSEPRSVDPARTRSTGLYVQDQATIGRFEVLVGLRHEWHSVRQANGDWITQTAVIPRAGVLLDVSPSATVYASLSTGFEPQPASTLAQPQLFGGPFDPERSNQIEVGSKARFLDGRLFAAIAGYRIVKRNVLVNANIPGEPDRLEQRGETRSRGIELDVVGSISPQLDITANWALNRAEITQSDNPDEVGLINENAPLHQGGVWMKYRLADGPLNGAFIGGGLRAVTERETFDRSLTLPGYTIVDVLVGYRVGQMELSGYVDNVLDRTYWNGGYNYGRIFPGSPRAFRFKVGYTF